MANKYRNKRTSGFDSKKESKRYQELLLMERAGVISDLKRQVPFQLIPPQREQDTIGKRGGLHKGALIERAVTYFADFVYEQDGKTVVEDTKGLRTADYIIKRKLMLWVHGIRIKET